ncbi:MAG: tRNA (adenosine(37)-N6)-dimethylallyltransferase MiaA [Woeseiaceae bacterium]
MKNLAVCLMGPTATGKTDVAIELCERYPFDIISVDSALVYRNMNIGTAKPDAETLQRAPHQLVDILDPEEAYSAGDFVRDARQAMLTSFSVGRVPLLVGGTMMYFRALTEGIAGLPSGNAAVREAIDKQAEEAGWPAMHERLREVDPIAADRIKPNDSQRIQRALEVFEISGRSLSDWHATDKKAGAAADTSFLKVALDVAERSVLHDRIERRLDTMFDNGFVEEVTGLREREGLDRDMPSMRSVGYRQVWAHLEGELTLDEARYRALVATRQLAKRQFTWLRSESDLFSINALEAGKVDAISEFLKRNHPILG